jgi:hypothetical protein
LGFIKKKNSARLLWNTTPSYVVNPKNIKFWTAEVVLPIKQETKGTQSLFNVLSNIRIERNRMNRLIWGNNLLTMQGLLASGYEGKVEVLCINSKKLIECMLVSTPYYDILNLHSANLNIHCQTQMV